MGSQDQMIDFRMYFAGLMVFDYRQKEREVEALLVDARKPGSVEGTAGIPPHYPVVQFAYDDAVGDRRAFSKFVDREGQLKGYLPLDADVLELDASVETEEQDLELVDVAPQGPIPVSYDDAASFQWIAPLRGEGGEKAAFNKRLFQVNGTPVIGERIAATVRMTRGLIQPAAFASEFQQFIVVQFDDSSQRAIASVVKLAAKVRGESVRLRTRKFDGSEGEVLELVPPREGGRRIEVWVLNREWDAIEHQVQPAAVRFGEGNPDYKFFDKLLTNPAAKLPTGVDRVKPKKIGPNIAPCADPSMRKLYFPTDQGGENALAAPCSPAHTS